MAVLKSRFLGLRVFPLRLLALALRRGRNRRNRSRGRDLHLLAGPDHEYHVMPCDIDIKWYHVITYVYYVYIYIYVCVCVIYICYRAMFFLSVKLVTTQQSCHSITCIIIYIIHDVTAHHAKHHLVMYINRHISLFFIPTQIDRKVNKFQLI